MHMDHSHQAMPPASAPAPASGLTSAHLHLNSSLPPAGPGPASKPFMTHASTVSTSSSFGTARDHGPAGLHMHNLGSSSSYELWATGPGGARTAGHAGGHTSSMAPSRSGAPPQQHYVVPASQGHLVATAATRLTTGDGYMQHSSVPTGDFREAPMHSASGMPHGADMSGSMGPSMGSNAAEVAVWQLRMEAKVDRLTSEIAQLRHLLLNSGVLMPAGKSPGMGEAAPVHMPMSHVRVGMVHSMVPNIPSSSGHSTSDKIDARRRRYPGFRGVPICACCNKSFCLIFNSPGGKCKRGDQCEHAHHYMPPNAPTGSIVRPLPVPASFK